MEAPDINDEKIGPTILREFDEHSGENFVEKGLSFGKRGAYFGAITGGFGAILYEPSSKVNGFLYALRFMGKGAVIAGSAGAVLGIGVPVAQALRGKNDPVAWGIGGFAAGSVLGLKSGKLGFAIQMGSLFATIMATAKLTEGYKRPYADSFAHARAKPKLHKLFDEEGKLITHTQH